MFNPYIQETLYRKARRETYNKLKNFHETKEYKEYEKNPTKENLEKARLKREEIFN